MNADTNARILRSAITKPNEGAFELTIGQQYKIAEPMPDDRLGDKKLPPESLWVMPYDFRLVAVMNDGTVKLVSSKNPNATPFFCDARRLRGF